MQTQHLTAVQPSLPFVTLPEGCRTAARHPDPYLVHCSRCGFAWSPCSENQARRLAKRHQRENARKA